MNKEILNLKENSLVEVKTYFKPTIDPLSLPFVKNSSQAYDVFYQIWDHDNLCHIEQVYMLMLNAQSRVMAYRLLSTGGISSTLIDIRVVFQTALLSNAVSIILAHNHPSGTLNPSQSDINITKRVIDAGNILNIEFFDHLIITSNGYLSMIDHGFV